MEALRQFNLFTAALRLLLAIMAGGLVGYGRSKRDRAAGLRTYILISLGACMSVLLTLYDFEMLRGPWADIVARAGPKFDASRLPGQAVTGIIIKVAHQQVKGLTTATGMFATVCLGKDAGAGFYECLILAMLLIVLVLNVMSPLESAFKRRLRTITLNVEFDNTEAIEAITKVIEAQDATVYDIDVERAEQNGDRYPSAIFILQLSRKNHSHSGMLTTIAELGCVHSVQELIS